MRFLVIEILGNKSYSNYKEHHYYYLDQLIPHFAIGSNLTLLFFIFRSIAGTKLDYPPLAYLNTSFISNSFDFFFFIPRRLFYFPLVNASFCSCYLSDSNKTLRLSCICLIISIDCCCCSLGKTNYLFLI